MSADTTFETQSTVLSSGDRLLIHSDGMDSLALSAISKIGRPAPSQGMLSVCYREFASLGSESFLAVAHERISALDHEMCDIDDLTMLILDLG